jgi:L-asparaginase II
MSTTLAHVTRGNTIESVHQGHIAVVDADGNLLCWGGDPQAHVFFRSSAKIFQAIPLVTTGAADASGFSSAELAMAFASHNATSRHQAIVSSMLRNIGLTGNDLQCGFTPPVDEAARARIALGLDPPTPVACECSGEHAGMLAACRHAGWSTERYTEPDHPLQRLIQAIVAAATGMPPSALTVATDGCSIPTFGAPLEAFARAYGVLADPDEAAWSGYPEWRAALHRLRDAMLLHPDLIAGDGETDTTIMQLTAGRVVAKLGAEGLLCLSSREHRLGIAISDAGGSPRSLGPAAVAVLRDLELVDRSTIERLGEALCPSVQTFGGQPVGVTRPALRLERSLIPVKFPAPVSQPDQVRGAG